MRWAIYTKLVTQILSPAHRDSSTSKSGTPMKKSQSYKKGMTFGRIIERFFLDIDE